MPEPCPQQRPIAPWPSGNGADRECDEHGPGSSSSSSNASSKARIHTAAEWRAMSSVIKQLYIVEHRKLAEVMSILEQQYGFKATEQMYKKRFAAWGLAKNKRRLPSKSTTPEVSCTEEATQEDSAVQSDLACKHGTRGWRCRTSLGYPLTGQNSAESAMYSVTAWTNGNFDGPFWLESNQRYGYHTSKVPSTYPSTQMCQDMALSQALLERQQGSLAGMAVRKAFWDLGKVITIGDPGMMRNLVDVVFQMTQLKQTPLLRMLLSQMANLANERLPPRHPLIQFFRQLSKLDDDLPEVVGRTFRCFVDRLQYNMGEKYFWLFEHWIWDSSIRNIDTDPEADYECVTEALQTLALSTGVESSALSRQHLEVLQNTDLIRCKDFLHVSTGAILQLLQEGDDSIVVNDPRVKVYVQTAKVKRAMDRKDWRTARDLMHSTIENLEKTAGYNSMAVIRELWSLEKVLIKAGRLVEAHEIERDAINRVSAYLSEVPSYMQ